MSAPRSWAARKTLRPMRPKPLIPTRTDMTRTLSVSGVRALRLAARGRSGARGRAVDVAVLDLDEVAVVGAEVGRQILGDHHGAMPPAGAPDRHHEMRLALADVLREQVLEQRDDAVVELLQAAVACDVLDDPRVEPGQHAQLGLVVRVG